MKTYNTNGNLALQNDLQERFFENKIAVEWLSTDQAARYLSITPNALRILVFRNRVRAYKFGHRLRFRLKDLQSLLIKKEA